MLILGHYYFLAALINLRNKVKMFVLLLLSIMHLMLDSFHLFLLVYCLVVQS